VLVAINSKGKKEYKENIIHQNLLNTKFDIIICDEAHRKKNKDAGRSVGVKLLNSRYKVALTGTPIRNRPNDLWSILNWLYPLEFRSYWNFVNSYCEVEKNNFGTKPIGLTKNVKQIEILDNILKNKMVRNIKEDVLKELPRKIYQDIMLKMGKKQTKKYNELVNMIKQEQDELTPKNILSKLLRLQQCTTNPELFGIVMKVILNLTGY